MIRFRCECGRQLQAAEAYVGQPAACPLCGKATVVPDSDQPDRGGTGMKPVGQFGEIARPFAPARPAEVDEDAPPRIRRPLVSPANSQDARAAMVLSLLGLVCQLACPFAIFYAVKALNRIAQGDDASERGQVVAAFILSVIGSVLLLIQLFCIFAL